MECTHVYTLRTKYYDCSIIHSDCAVLPLTSVRPHLLMICGYHSNSLYDDVISQRTEAEMVEFAARTKGMTRMNARDETWIESQALR